MQRKEQYAEWLKRISLEKLGSLALALALTVLVIIMAAIARGVI